MPPILGLNLARVSPILALVIVCPQSLFYSLSLSRSLQLTLRILTPTQPADPTLSLTWIGAPVAQEAQTKYPCLVTRQVSLADEGGGLVLVSTQLESIGRSLLPSGRLDPNPNSNPNPDPES